MGLFNRKIPEGRDAEEHNSSRTSAELEVSVEERAMTDPITEADEMIIEASAPAVGAESAESTERAEPADPFGDELRELEEKAVTDEPAPVAEPSAAADASAGKL